MNYLESYLIQKIARLLEENTTLRPQEALKGARAIMQLIKDETDKFNETVGDS